MAAKELPDKRVVLQARVTSMLIWPASIIKAAISAPAGYEVQELSQELQSLYPLQVRPVHLQSVHSSGSIDWHAASAVKLQRCSTSLSELNLWSHFTSTLSICSLSALECSNPATAHQLSGNNKELCRFKVLQGMKPHALSACNPMHVFLERLQTREVLFSRLAQ